VLLHAFPLLREGEEPTGSRWSDGSVCAVPSSAPDRAGWLAREKLLVVLDRLVDAGNTVVVIEHNLGVITCADWVVDLGPEGSEEGGRVIAEGTPEEITRERLSYTGQHLSAMLAAHRSRVRPVAERAGV